MRRDSIGYGGGLNLYSYVKNNSVNYADPFGLRCPPHTLPHFDPETGSENEYTTPPKCCPTLKVTKGNWNITPDIIELPITINASFADAPPPCQASCCEYRQYLTGFVSVAGQPYEHLLYNGVPLDPITPNEDCDSDGNPYGHRDNNNSLGTYSGNTYSANDFPGFKNLQNLSDTSYPLFLNFDFISRIIDVCQGGTAAEQKWSMTIWANDPNEIITDDQGLN